MVDHLVIPEPQHPPSLMREIRVPPSIPVWIVVGITVYLDNDPPAGTREVDDVSADHLLSPEPDTHLRPAQFPPEDSLTERWITPHRPSTREEPWIPS